ncbi:hypothetical protein MFRU_013g00690 [Monilinia fructicola]|nr:hypothetical protein MFRU_013g00690 [Monilinia fructicola]
MSYRRYRSRLSGILQPQSDLITPIDPDGPSLAEELGDLEEEFESDPTLEDELSYLENEFERDVKESETSNQRNARQQAEEAIAKHEKFLKDNNMRPRSPEGREPSPPPLSEARRRFPEKQYSGLHQASAHSYQVSRPSSQAPRRSWTSLTPSQVPLPSSPTPSQIPLPSSPTPSQIPLPSSPTPSQIPLPSSPTPSQIPLPSSRASSRNNERARIVKPPPLSPGVFDTISREYGWAWLWWLLIAAILATLVSYTRQKPDERLLTKGTKIAGKTAGAAGKGTFWTKDEIANSKSVISIAISITDVAKILTDGVGALKRLEDSPFNQAVLPIEQLRKQILEGEERYQPLFWMIDKFVSKNREVDHDWRSFLQQQTEATAVLAGMFDGYAKNAISDGNQINWMRAAHNITQEDYSDIPKKVQREGELLLCELLAKQGETLCPTGPKLIDIYDELKKSLEKLKSKVPPGIFVTYSSTTTDIAKTIKTILKIWERTTKRIETSKMQYKNDYGIGDTEKVVLRLNSTMNNLAEAMESPLVHRLACPEFPAAIRRLEENKVRIKAFQH